MTPHCLYRLIVGCVLIVPFIAAAVVLKVLNFLAVWRWETVAIGGEDIL